MSDTERSIQDRCVMFRRGWRDGATASPASYVDEDDYAEGHAAGYSARIAAMRAFLHHHGLSRPDGRGILRHDET